jgi:hypothetical protein
MAVCSHLNFSFEFWGVLPALFYPYGAFLSESKTPPGVPVHALVIEKRVQNLVRLTACSSAVPAAIVLGSCPPPCVACHMQMPSGAQVPFLIC